MLRLYRLAVFTLVAAGAFAQTPRQIQERQQAEVRALEREAAARDQKLHEAQVEQMRQIDRQQAEEQREQDARAAQAQAVAAQQQLVLLRQQAEQQQQAERRQQDGDSAPVAQTTPVAPAGKAQPQAQPPAVAHWSFSNMTNRDKAGIAGLGILLVALAFAAGIVPARFTWK